MMLEEEIEIMILGIEHFINTLDDQEFKRLFIDYIGYMARNYNQECLILEYYSLLEKSNLFLNKHHLIIKDVYRYNKLLQWINRDYLESDLLLLCNSDNKNLHRVIEDVENKMTSN